MGDNKRNGEKTVNRRYIKAIIRKDWKEIAGNPQLIIPILVIPILLGILMPIFIGAGAISDPEEFGASDPYGAIISTLSMFKPLFLMAPTIVSVVIASDSIVGERERKTIETLLTLPITDTELYIGKMLVALIPSLICSITVFGVMGVALNILMLSSGLTITVPVIFSDLSFWIIALVLAPLFSMVSIGLGIIASAHARDVKSAQNLSVFVIFPIIGLVFGSLAIPGLMSNYPFLLLLVIIFGITVYILIKIGADVINREKLISYTD